MYQTKYHKTGQYRNAVKHLNNLLSFDGLDEEGNVTRKTIEDPVVQYLGTVKLHGTNANIVMHEDRSITLHSKEQYLATITPDDHFELGRDNMGFATEMFQRVATIRSLFEEAIRGIDLGKFPLKLSGEWVGQGVQKGVGVSFLPKKSFFFFNLQNGDGVNMDTLFWGTSPEQGFFNILDFPTYYIEVDVTNPDKATVDMAKIVEQVENECPVAKALGVTECLIGEGIVWTPVDKRLYADTGTWFKTKGQKHSSSKVKKLVSADPEKLESIEKFIEYAVTDNRLEQGLEHVELDPKHTGQFIGWVNRDINQEEADVLEESNLEMKDVGKFISQKAREFFLGRC